MKIMTTFFKTILFIILCNSLGYAQTVVIEAGVGGHSTSQMLSRINSDVLSLNPETTIVLGGTNDMLNSGKLATIAQYDANIRNIIDQLQAINSEVILLTIPPCIEEELLKRHDASAFLPDTPNGRVILANAALAQIAIDKNVLLLDTYALFNDNISLLSSDGVHPSGTGYQTMTDLIYNTIIDNNYPNAKVACFGDSITRGYSSLLASLFAGSEGGTGEFEFLFDTDDDFEGWTSFNNPGTTSMAVTSGGLQATYINTDGYFGIQYTADLEFSSAHPYVAIKIDHLPASRMSYYMASTWYNDDKNGFSSLANTTLNNAGIYVYDLSTNGPGFGSSATQIFAGGGNYTDTDRVIFLIDDGDTSGTTNATYNDIEWIKNFASLQDIAQYAGLTLGVNDLQQDVTAVYPNPIKGVFTITKSLGAEVEIYNIAGKLLTKSKIENKDQQIDISDFVSGIYFVHINNNGIRTTKKIIKK